MNDQREKSVPRLYGYVTQGLRTDQPRRNLDTRPLNTLKLKDTTTPRRTLLITYARKINKKYTYG